METTTSMEVETNTSVATTSSVVTQQGGKSTQKQIQLGFAELLDEGPTCDTFPSKVGGHPVWLVPEDIPKVQDLICGRCGEIMSFLLQIYAPLTLHESTYHRTLYVFCCRKYSCIKYCPEGSFKVLRAQLPKDNKYYKLNNMQQQSGDDDEAEEYGRVLAPRTCRVSGLYGSFRCSGCQSVYYANKKFQQEDWYLSHKQDCASIRSLKTNGGDMDVVSRMLSQKLQISTNKKPVYKSLFKEYEIVTEPAKISTQCNPEEDALPLDIVENDSDQDDEDKLALQNQKIVDHYKKLTSKYDHSEFEDHNDWLVSESQKDTFFKNFQTVSSQEPEQILRYYEDQATCPLWVSSSNRPTIIQPCLCGAERFCEFQIMPQLLYLLELEDEEDAMDWGTLVVYTCKNSCTTSLTYTKEYLFPQQISAT